MLTRRMIIAQGAATIVAFAALALWPPSSGRMLLIPLGGGAANSVAKAAVMAGANLLGSGPLPGSLVVMGNRARILRTIAGWDVLVVAAPLAGCGLSGRIAASA